MAVVTGGKCFLITDICQFIKNRREAMKMLLIPKDENYRKVLGNLESKVAMNLKCGACADCTGSRCSAILNPRL